MKDTSQHGRDVVKEVEPDGQINTGAAAMGNGFAAPAVC